MGFVYYNPNPQKNLVGDCVIRAISKATGDDWYKTYSNITLQGLAMRDMPSSNAVWAEYLKKKGFHRYIIPDTCPDCYTVERFAIDNPIGTFILGTGTHAVTVQDGNYFDTWNSGNEMPIYYFKKEE